MTEQADDRVMVDDVQVVMQTDYHNEPVPRQQRVTLTPGRDPFVLFQMKQVEGVLVLDVTASLLESEEELIETLEVFFETMLAEREQRALAAAEVDAAVDEYLDEQMSSDD